MVSTVQPTNAIVHLPCVYFIKANKLAASVVHQILKNYYHLTTCRTLYYIADSPQRNPNVWIGPMPVPLELSFKHYTVLQVQLKLRSWELIGWVYPCIDERKQEKLAQNSLLVYGNNHYIRMHIKLYKEAMTKSAMQLSVSWCIITTKTNNMAQ